MLSIHPPSTQEYSNALLSPPGTDQAGRCVIWIAGAGSLLLLVLLILGLWGLTRNRYTMGTRTGVIWALVLILLPVLGLVWYLFWRISRAEMLQREPPPVVHRRE